eukprot:scaffold1590_cov417-Prasinococcus_capsulatus_cf.AAC.13
MSYHPCPRAIGLASLDSGDRPHAGLRASLIGRPGQQGGLASLPARKSPYHPKKKGLVRSAGPSHATRTVRARLGPKAVDVKDVKVGMGKEAPTYRRLREELLERGVKSTPASTVLEEVASGKAVLLDCRYARDAFLYGVEPAGPVATHAHKRSQSGLLAGSCERTAQRVRHYFFKLYCERSPLERKATVMTMGGLLRRKNVYVCCSNGGTLKEAPKDFSAASATFNPYDSKSLRACYELSQVGDSSPASSNVGVRANHVEYGMNSIHAEVTAGKAPKGVSERGIWPGQLLFFSYNVEGPKPWTWDPVLVFKTFSYDFIDSIR